MTADVFLDAGILVHAVDADPAGATRRDRARALIREDRFGTSAQVVQEFYETSTRRLAPPLRPHVAARWVDRLLRMPFVPTDAVLVKTAIIRAHAFGIPYWEAAVLSAAEVLGARTLYSEKLSHGRTYGAVTIVNPFLETTQR